MTKNDTIYALSSGSVPAGVAVVRVSGPLCELVVETLTGSVPPPRKAVLCSLRDRQGDFIDSGLVIYFPAPHSFTGESCVEFQVHGSRPVIKKIFAEVAELDGVRFADAGEFSLRAFHNGKMDLVEVEGLSDLISAETEMQRRLAVEQSKDGVSQVYETWRRRLIHARAMLEAELDFADEDDIPGSVSQTVTNDLCALSQEINEFCKKASLGNIIQNGFQIVIAGAPNAGKSTLLNYLVQRDVAIVTEVAGTTRDILSVKMDIDGFAVHLLDTAGLRVSSDIVEQEGIRRARQAMDDADLILYLSSQSDTDRDFETVDGNVVAVASQTDRFSENRFGNVFISVKDKTGINSLLNAIKKRLPSVDSRDDLLLPGKERHLNFLQAAILALNKSLETPIIELKAEHLRDASNQIGRITGKIDVEDLLDVIFSQFCVGK